MEAGDQDMLAKIAPVEVVLPAAVHHHGYSLVQEEATDAGVWQV